MRILFFGRLRDLAGASEMNAPPDFASLSDLRRWLADGHAELATALEQSGVRVAVDKSIVHGDAPLAGVREVAFMPPMSGG